jgi:hypothetical protein
MIHRDRLAPVDDLVRAVHDGEQDAESLRQPAGDPRGLLFPEWREYANETPQH